MLPSFPQLALEDEEFNIILKFKAGHKVPSVNQVASCGLRKALDDMKMV